MAHDGCHYRPSASNTSRTLPLSTTDVITIAEPGVIKAHVLTAEDLISIWILNQFLQLQFKTAINTSLKSQSIAGVL